MSGYKIPVYYSEALSRFNFGQGHPFRGDRFAEFMNLLDAVGLSELLDIRDLQIADNDDLYLVHTEEFVERVEHLEKIGGNLTLDTPVNSEVLKIQKLIAGSGLQAAKLLLESDVQTAHTFGGFHHAGKDYGEGFCLLNDVAIAAKALIERHGLKRILVIDTDAHQGNGTMNIFYNDPRVLFISIHQDPRTLYPGMGFVHETGAGEGLGFTVNVPMPPYSGNWLYERAMDEVCFPIAKAFEPELIVRNGGSDPYLGDELTLLGLDYDGLYMLGRKVRDMSDVSCKKLLDMMVSGYGPSVIYGWLAIFCGVERLDVDYKAHSPPEFTGSRGFPPDVLEKMFEEMLTNLKGHLEPYWDL